MSIEFDDQVTPQVAAIRYQKVTPPQSGAATWLVEKGMAKDGAAATALINRILVTGIVFLTIASLYTLVRVYGDPEAPPIRREYQNGATGETFISQ